MTKEEKFQNTFKSRLYNRFARYRCEYCFTPYFFSKDIMACCADKRRAHAPSPMGNGWAFLPYDYWIREHTGRQIYNQSGSGPVYRMPSRICPVCNGTGRHNGVTCGRCDGLGKIY